MKGTVGSQMVRKRHIGTDQLKEFKRLQKEDERLRTPVSNLTLDNLILSEAAKEDFYAHIC